MERLTESTTSSSKCKRINHYNRLCSADYDFVLKKKSEKPIKIYDSFKLKESEEKIKENESKNKIHSKRNRHVSDAGNFMIADKSEVKSPLLDKERDDENGF